MPARACGMIRTVRANRISRKTSTTIATMAPAMPHSFSLFAHERGRALDLHNLHAPALLDHLIVVERARSPHFPVDPDASDAFVVGDALEHDRLLADERRRAGPDLRRHLHVGLRDRP